LTSARVLLLALERLSGPLRQAFSTDGFDLFDCRDLADFLFTASTGNFDLLLVDHAVCAGSAIEIGTVLASIPDLAKSPVLIFGAPKASTTGSADRIHYLRELLASDEVRMRMHMSVRRLTIANARRLQRHGDVELDIDRLLVIRGSKRAPISYKQAKLLSYMMDNPAQVYSRRHLLEAVWQNPDAEEGTVTVMIVRLRKLLERIGRPDMIKTVSKTGYLLDF
jgi:two-component system, OmpR family, phosphate regulon response regulator PhoB